MAKMAAADPTAPSNPVKVGPRELKGLYENALAGRLA
jgi:alcohol dehydrogenase class IV